MCSSDLRELLKLVKAMVEEKAKEQGIEPRLVRFTRRDIREYSGWSDNQIKAHVRRLEDLEYLAACRTGEHRGYRYELGAREIALKSAFGLVDAQRLEKLGSVGHGWVREQGLFSLKTESLFAERLEKLADLGMNA